MHTSKLIVEKIYIPHYCWNNSFKSIVPLTVHLIINCRLAQHSWKVQHWTLVNVATIEGATVSIGTILMEGATLEIGE